LYGEKRRRGECGPRGSGGLSAFTAKRLAQKKSLGSLGASVIAVIIFSLAGVVVLVVGFFAAVLIAQAMHGMR
jgi:hypothetical protein